MNEYDDCMTDLTPSVIKSAAKRRFTGDLAVRVLDSVGSTNAWIREHISVTPLAPRQTLVCAAEHQTAGRGRRGKTWHSPSRGVTFTTAFSVSLPAHQLSGLSLLCGVSVCTVLREHGIDAARVKWPNDILVANAKLVGILIEVISVKPGTTVIIAGIGVNYRRGPEAELIDQTSTDLYQLIGHSLPDRSELIGDIVGEVRRRCDGNIAASVAALAPRWPEYDALYGRPIECSGGGVQPLTGIGAGIDRQGQLLIRHEQGTTAVAAGEVSVRRT